MKSIKRRTSILIISIIILIIFLSVLEYRSFLELKENFHNSLINEYKAKKEAILDSYEKNTELLFNTHFNTKEVQELMYKANIGNEDERENLRNKLLNKYDNVYSHMVKCDFRQLHFHLEDEITSFLRFHKINMEIV